MYGEFKLSFILEKTLKQNRINTDSGKLVENT